MFVQPWLLRAWQRAHTTINHWRKLGFTSWSNEGAIGSSELQREPPVRRAVSSKSRPAGQPSCSGSHHAGPPSCEGYRHPTATSGSRHWWGPRSGRLPSSAPPVASLLRTNVLFQHTLYILLSCFIFNYFFAGYCFLILLLPRKSHVDLHLFSLHVVYFYFFNCLIL